MEAIKYPNLKAQEILPEKTTQNYSVPENREKQMTSLLDQVKNEDFNNLESSQNFHKISNGELKEILDYVKTSKKFLSFCLC